MTLQATVHPVGEAPKAVEPRAPRLWVKHVVGYVFIVALFTAMLASFWTYRLDAYWNEPYTVTTGVVKKVEIYSARRQAYFRATTETEGRVVIFRTHTLPQVGETLTVYRFGSGQDAYYSINDGRVSGKGMGKTEELFLFALAAAFGAALTCGWWSGRVNRLRRV